MNRKEPFREAFKIPSGMLKSDPFKDDPRYHGGRLPMPLIGEDIVLKPSILMLIPRIIVWVLVFYIFRGEEMLGTAGSKWLLEGLCVLDIIFAVPKFLFEHTTVKQEGIERSILWSRKLFPWEDFHTLERDFLGLSFRTKPGWGIWKDEFNFIISWLYYTPAAIRLVADLFAHGIIKPKEPMKAENGRLINLNP